MGSVQEEHKAGFLWPNEPGSLEEAGYEFANAATEEYRQEWWQILCARSRDRGVTARDGLLWRGEDMIMLPEADYIAHCRGFTCAEQLVEHLSNNTAAGNAGTEGGIHGTQTQLQQREERSPHRQVRGTHMQYP